ncbi:MAG: ORF6N domain-containing protein [archaeon]
MVENDLITQDNLKYKIYTIRDTQVMLDSDLAKLYKIEAIRLREQVKRNSIRFPNNFMFQLNLAEIDFMVSQNAIPSKKHLGGTLPYVFTEQGVAMLSGVLKTKTAVNISIQIIDAFVSMRRFISRNTEIFNRLDSVERKQFEYQLKTDNKLEIIFDAIESRDIIKKQGIFFDGQVFDAYKFVSDLIRSAKKSIILIDNYIDDSVLTLFTKVSKNVNITIYTENITKQLKLDLEKYNSQYNPIIIKKFKKSHDRFLIIDNIEIYHFGASIKDLGKKWFGFAKLDKENTKILDKL